MEIYQYYQPSNIVTAAPSSNIYYVYTDPPSSNYYPRFAYYNPYNTYQVVCNNYVSVSTDAPKKMYYDTITKNQLTQLKAQISAYKLLLKSNPIPNEIFIEACGKKYDESKKMNDDHERNKDNDKIDNVKIDCLDHKYIRNMYEMIVKERVVNRMSQIANETDVKLKIEFKSLKLLDLQRELRNDILSDCKDNKIFSQKLNIKLYQKHKYQRLNESRINEQLEFYKNYDDIMKQEQKFNHFVTTILQHGIDLREQSRNNFADKNKINQGVIGYFANNRRNKKKEQERIEKERMRRLMAEDEEGYRKLIDEKKDSRLHFLLSQTDEFIVGLTSLVKQHKKDQIHKKEIESNILRTRMLIDIISKILNKKFHLSTKENARICSDLSSGKTLNPKFQNIRIDVINSVTNESLTDENAPLLRDILNWLKQNPNWKPICDSLEDTYLIEDNEDHVFQSNVASTENSNDVSNIHLIDDDEYDKNESYYTMAHFIQEKVTEQPSQMKSGGILKKYQIQGLEWLVSLYNNNLNGILADEMGLGKTIQTISLISYLMEKKKVYGPYLIIVPLSTISNWSIEFERWAPLVNIIVYKGSPNFRKSVQSKLKNGKFNVVLTTYEYIIKDKCVLSKILWKYIIIDEGHRMKNHHCKLTQILNAHYQTSYRLLLTGTPLQNNLPELWALLNFLLPSIFQSVTTFEQWFNAPFANSGEKVELNQEETLLIIRRLHKVLRPFLLRRLKKEVENQLPDKVEYVVKCEMSALQRTLYNHMQNKGVILTDGSENDQKGFGGSRTLLNTLMQLRKICNHPFMFQHIEQAIAENNFLIQSKDRKNISSHLPSEVFGPDLFRVSGKFELLDRVLPKLKARNHRVLLFCQMTSLMSIMGVYFEYRGFKYLRLDGSTKSEDREELLHLFNNSTQDYFIFMLSTRAGGLGLNLQSADTVVIFDSDWNPHLDLQAQDRAHRIGQKNEVRVLRLIINNSVEEKILAAAKFKLNVDEKVIQAGMFDQKSTGNERRQFLQALLKQEDMTSEESVGGHTENECPDDETINQMIARNEEEFEIYQRMDSERILEDERKTYMKSRLLLYDEMPAWIIKCDSQQSSTETKCSNQSNQDTPSLSKRVRKEVDYSDSLTESQIKKHILNDDFCENDNGENSSSKEENDVDLDLKKERKRKRSEKFIAPNNKDPNQSKVKTNSSRLSKIQSKALLDDKTNNKPSSASMSSEMTKKSSSNQPQAKRRKLNSSVLTDTIASEDKRRSREFQRLINKLLDYREKDGRIICEPFVKLPTKRELPDYYEVIKKPMDFVKIRQKLKDNKYKDMDELSSDIYLLCKNAQVYNMDGSLIFEDSILIHQLWDEIKQEFDQRKPTKNVIKKEQQTAKAVKKVSIETITNEEAQTIQKTPALENIEHSSEHGLAVNCKQLVIKLENKTEYFQ